MLYAMCAHVFKISLDYLQRVTRRWLRFLSSWLQLSDAWFTLLLSSTQCSWSHKGCVLSI